MKVFVNLFGDRQTTGIANGIVWNVTIGLGEDVDVNLGLRDLLERKLDRVEVPFRGAEFHHDRRVGQALNGVADFSPMLGQIHRRAADHDVQTRIVRFDDDVFSRGIPLGLIHESLPSRQAATALLSVVQTAVRF